MKTRISPKLGLRGQAGATLFVSLMIVLALTVTSLGVLYAVSQLQRTARSARDREIAVQAAEATMRDAEWDLNCLHFVSGSAVACVGGTSGCRPAPFCPAGSNLLGRGLLGFSDSAGGKNCPNGLCVNAIVPASGGGIWTENSSVWSSNSSDSVQYATYTNNVALMLASADSAGSSPPALYQQPRYFIEGFTDPYGYPMYRITAHAWGISGDISVTLQEFYRPWNQ
jgi:Tfp pilus assembly protein PilX